MNTASLNIAIKVDDKGSVKIEKLGKTVQATGDKGEQSFGRMRHSLVDFDSQANSSIGTIKTLFSAVAASAVVATLASVSSASIQAASALEEVSSKFDVVFQGQEEQAESWSRTLMESYGMSTRESKQYLSSVQDLLVPMGMAADEAGVMSNQIVKLSADLGSFNDQPTGQVMDDIQSALVGNYETMKKYGVVLNATTVEQKALNMGLADSKHDLTAADKAMAAYKLMLEGSAAAIGDFGRTQDSYANQLKTFNARIEDIKAGIGQGLLPVLSDLLGKFNDWYLRNEKIIQQDLKGWGETGAAAISGVATAAGATGATMQTLAAAALAVSGGIFTLIGTVEQLTDAVGLTDNATNEWFDNATAAFSAADGLAMKAGATFDSMSNSSAQAAEKQKLLNDKVQETTGSINSQADAQGKLNKEVASKLTALVKDEEDAAKERETAIDDMYNEAGLGADEYFNNEATKLVERASQWQTNGADTLEVEAWLYDKLGELSEEAWGRGEDAAGLYMGSLQQQSRTLVEEFDDTTQTIHDQLDETGIKISELDGSNIHLTASFDGSAAMSGYDSLIEKMKELQRVAARSSSGANSSSSETGDSGGSGGSGSGSSSIEHPNIGTQSSGQSIVNGGNSSQSTTTNIINFNQKVSRSDAVNVIRETKRAEARA